jgi:hypothetical protein
VSHVFECCTTVPACPVRRLNDGPLRLAGAARVPSTKAGVEIKRSKSDIGAHESLSGFGHLSTLVGKVYRVWGPDCWSFGYCAVASRVDRYPSSKPIILSRHTDIQAKIVLDFIPDCAILMEVTSSTDVSWDCIRTPSKVVTLTNPNSDEGTGVPEHEFLYVLGLSKAIFTDQQTSALLLGSLPSRGLLFSEQREGSGSEKCPFRVSN